MNTQFDGDLPPRGLQSVSSGTDSPGAVRAQLLEQHRQIRELMVTTKEVAVRARSGETDREELRATVASLADCVRAHNRREEELLLDFILTVDAWGPVRAAIMTAEHVKEHNRFDAALLGLRSASAENAGVGVIALIALLRDHMEREEAAFLGDDVLRDDAVVPAQSDG
jgi:hypothetical protein